MFFTILLDTALSAYATEIACLQSFSDYILLPVSCTLLSAATSLPFPVGCPRRSAWHGRECAVEADVLPSAVPSIRCGAPSHVAYCSESTVQLVCVMEYVAVVVQQSRASVLTCSDSKTRSQHGFLLCIFVSGHVSFTLPLRTYTFVMASVRRSTYFHTFSAYLVVYVVTV